MKSIIYFLNESNITYKEIPKDEQSDLSKWGQVNIKGIKYDFLKFTDNNKQYVIETEKDGEIGTASVNDYDKNFNGIYLDNIRIDNKHRRLGLATLMYEFIEEDRDDKLQPSPIKQSQEIKTFWKNKKIT